MNRYAKFLLIGLLPPSLCLGLESDSEQQISIQADSALFSELDGATQYLGDVELVQGSISVTSDQLMVYSNEGEIERIVATGNPATYRQLPEVGDEMVVARSMTIDYKVSEDMLYLVDEASLVQGETALRGNTIVYDVKANTLRASGSPGTESERVQVIIPPSNSGAEGAE